LEFIVSWYASISVEMYIRPSSLTLGLVLGFLLPLFGVVSLFIYYFEQIKKNFFYSSYQFEKHYLEL